MADAQQANVRGAAMIALIALGHTNTEIAQQLYLSVRTVETHRAHIQQKLRVSSRADINPCVARFAAETAATTSS